ncbi:carbonic anhydrase 4 isoform X2 [Monodelphis domestica]|uniref:carbonic anhydrase 4 isoform X2 n=1 Tax=Monodelphis domestica TaxID=13616 RepID=UPI0024E1E7F3|nr:carbonic anhydrase 4 isoform X2 [Monodelphis domestica]
MSLFLKLLALTLAQSVASEDDWCYSSQAKVLNCSGPEAWPGYCQTGEQSPINIITKQIKLNYSLVDFKFSGYDLKQETFIKNNGYTIKMPLPDSAKISGGGLSGTYKGVESHLHWSDSVDKGSEHTIDGKAFAMEMHVIHMKEKFANLSMALASSDRDAFAVLGFLIEASNQKHEGFQIILDALDKVSYKNGNTSTKPLSLEELLPDVKNRKKYFRYMGSLTTPDCDVKVIWTVFKTTIGLHKDQILQFSKKLFYNEKIQSTPSPSSSPIKDFPIIDNFRPVQELKNRIVYHNGVEGLLPHTWPKFLAPLLTYLLAILLY